MLSNVRETRKNTKGMKICHSDEIIKLLSPLMDLMGINNLGKEKNSK